MKKATPEEWQALADKELHAFEEEGVARRLWDKDSSLWKLSPDHAAIIQKSLGWLHMPQVMGERIAELESFVSDARKEEITHVAVLGMGGSSLAPEVLRSTFPVRAGFPALHVLDSTNPEAVAALERAADPAQTLYVLSSKSGTTTEPLRLFDYFHARARKALGARRAGAHFAAITDPGTPLESLARELGFRKAFLNFPDIGGRYSALSYFGLVPAACLGLDVQALLESARRMAQACSPERPAAENPGLALGAALGAWAKAGRDKLTFLVPAEIASFGLWLEQLIAESTGKEGKGVVPLCGENLDGLTLGDDRAFVHVRLDSAKDPLDAQAQRLREAGFPVLGLRLAQTLDLGAEFFRWEVATAALGHSLGIDPFDQPDVQSAKDRTKAVLDELTRTGSLPETRAQAQQDGLSLSFSKSCREKSLASFLSQAKPGDYAGLLAYLNPEGGYELELASLRQALGKAAQIPVQFGYGPRYLHSTGQLHKGGPNTGMFLLIMQVPERNLDIPKAGYGFGQLCAAQALGDFAALDGTLRRAVLIQLSGDAREGLRKLAKAVESPAMPGA